MNHLLIIGGSGMLRGVAIEFVRRGWAVSVVGRRLRPLEEIVHAAAQLPGEIHSLSLDYTQTDTFIQRLRAHFVNVGVPSVTVAWIHSTAPDTPRILMNELAHAATEKRIDFIHVLSRLRLNDPRDLSAPVPHADESELQNISHINYRKAILGWVVEPHGSRWLTDDEIAHGVIQAIDSGDAITAIGRIEPIDTNPHAG